MCAVALAFLGVGFRAARDVTESPSPASAATAAEGADPSRTIRYSLWIDEQHPVEATLRAWRSDFGQALISTTSIMTLQRSRPYEPISSVGRLGVYVASVALVGQTALKLFAVRRRFKR